MAGAEQSPRYESSVIKNACSSVISAPPPRRIIQLVRLRTLRHLVISVQVPTSVGAQQTYHRYWTVVHIHDDEPSINIVCGNRMQDYIGAAMVLPDLNYSQW